MSLFGDSLRRDPGTSDEAVRRYVIAIRADLDPDPLFQRRLRGTVLNRFVAAREGLEQAAQRSGRMGRLGRACLYATVVLATSVGGVMAASRGAVPGDLLYPVKLEIEALRMRALPAHFQDDLAVFALSQRINELGRLAEAGDWDAVAGMIASVEAAYAELDRVGVHETQQDGVVTRMEVLENLVARLPAGAESAIERVLEREPVAEARRPARYGGSGDRGTGHAPQGQRPASAGPVDPTGHTGEEKQPARTAGPAPAAKPSPTATPTPTAKPELGEGQGGEPEPQPSEDGEDETGD